MNKYNILAWFFPNNCLVCGKHIDANSAVCEKCLPDKTLERTFYIINGKKRDFFTCESLFLYDKYYRDCVKRFKFRGKKSYARKFVKFASQVLNLYELSKYDCICYVPMSKKSERKRGYNQAKLFAVKLSKITGLEVVDVLKKIKNNEIQHHLSKKERMKNVIGVYACVKDIKGQNILLIDDIITTGSTISQCAKILYKSGAKSVKGICIADRKNEIIEQEEYQNA